MLLLRLIGILAFIAIGVALALYAFSRERRYLRLAWRILTAVAVFALVLVAFYAAVRLLVVV